MASLFHKTDEPQYVCWDRKYYDTWEVQSKIMGTSKTVYVSKV